MDRNRKIEDFSEEELDIIRDEIKNHIIE